MEHAASTSNRREQTSACTNSTTSQNTLSFQASLLSHLAYLPGKAFTCLITSLTLGRQSRADAFAVNDVATKNERVVGIATTTIVAIEKAVAFAPCFTREGVLKVRRPDRVLRA